MPEVAPFRQLARRSLRVHALLIGVIALAILQAGLLLSTTAQLLDSEQKKVDLHFKRLGGALQEQERFVRGWRVQDPGRVEGSGEAAFQVPVAYLPYAMLGTDSTSGEGTDALARRFTYEYGSFWAESRFASPRCLLISPDGAAGVLVPSTAEDIGSERPPLSALQAALRPIHQMAPRASSQRVDVRWSAYEFGKGHPRLLSIARAPQDAAMWGMAAGSPSDAPAIACLLDVWKLDDHRELLGESIYDHLSIVSPDGRQIYGADVDASSAAGRTISLKGVVYRMHTDAGWQAIYQLRWDRILSQPRGPLISSIILALLLALGGALLLRSYRRSVLIPLRVTHERLLESEAFARTLLDNAPVGLCLLRKSDSEVLLDNAPARAWLGASHDSPGWNSAWRAAVQAGLETSHPNGQTFSTPGGRHLLVTATPVRYRGELVTLCLFIDLTAQYQAEQVLEQARSAADQASRAKSQFLATISHEIRTPLYGVLGTLELLGLTSLDARQQEYLSTIQRSSSTLLQLIGDILDVSKAEAGQLTLEPSAFNPAVLTEEVLRSFAGTATRRQLQLYACIDPDTDASFVGDAARIRQVLNNLISNAIKFTDVGRIVVRLTRLRVSGERPRLYWQVADTGIGIPQEHHARLFEPFYQANPGKDALRGTGLGLAISAHLVGLMAGELRVVSEMGLGSSFSFALPLPHSGDTVAPGTGPESSQAVFVRAAVRELAENMCDRLRRRGVNAQVFNSESPQQSNTGVPMLDVVLGEPVPDWGGPQVVAINEGSDHAESAQGRWVVSMHHLDGIVETLRRAGGGDKTPPLSSAEPARRALGLHVLIAEDNPINQRLLREQLEQLGCHAVAAGDGDEALGYWAQRPFDAVLTDINMPLMDGYALARALRHRGVAVPIIGATANAAPEERERCLEAGMNSCLVKPISLKALYRELRPFAQPGSVRELPSPDDNGAGDTLRVPGHLRSLFLTTMYADLEALDGALAARDAVQLQRTLHRMNGALVSVSGQALVALVGAIEDGMDAGAPLDASLAATEVFRAQLQLALARLAESNSDEPRTHS